jgi:predicted class III extradiol MEMO1 family dioxygenase
MQCGRPRLRLVLTRNAKSSQPRPKCYQFSGVVAAYSYIQLKGRSYDRVVVIAPSH